MSGSPMRLQVASGSGLVARFGDGVLVADARAPAPALDALVAILRDSCEGRARPGRMLVQRLARHLVGADPPDRVSFAALAPAEDGWAVSLHGDVELRVTRGDDGEQLSGRQAVTWADRLIADGFDRLVVGIDPESVQPLPGPFGLEAGVVPGAGVVVAVETGSVATHAGKAETPTSASASVAEPSAPRATAPGPAASSAPAAGEPAGSAFEPGASPTAGDAAAGVATAGDEAAGAATAGQPPVVTGVLCRDGHFNHPQARYCSVCGVAMLHRTRAPVQRPRPPLGVVVADDGTTYTLDVDHVVGRDPEEDPAVAEGRAHAVQLDDDELSVSRVHAGIRLEGWDVLLVDRGSANGTFVAPRDSDEWRRLEPNDPEVLAPGTRIAFGRRTATFESHHQA